MKPEWMPRLPKFKDMESAVLAKGYALAAVEAYKASLLPEMWGMLNDCGGWVKVAINASSDEEMLTLGWIPLYRLDGGDDE